MEQNRRFQNRCTYIGLIDFEKNAKGISIKKERSF